jgi:hypothetical protein
MMARWTKMILLKQGREVSRDITAIIAENGIRIEDIKLLIEEGDTLREILPNGLPDDYMVIDRGFNAHPKPCYLVQYIKNIKQPIKEPNKNITNIFHGNHSRINIDSVDSSINISDVAISSKFTEIRDAIKNIPDNNVHPILLAKLDELQASIFTETHSKTNEEFIALAANYTTILAPFFPYLNSLLERLVS